MTEIIKQTARLDFRKTEDISKLSKKKDEIGTMANAVNEMRSVLRELMAQMEQIKDNLVNNMDRLENVMKENNVISEDNSATTQELVAGMEETTANTTMIVGSIGAIQENVASIQKISEKQGEVSPTQIMDCFRREYLDRKEPLHFKRMRVEDMSHTDAGEFDTAVTVDYILAGSEMRSFCAVGNGPIDAVQRGLKENFGINIKVLDYEEHALQSGSNSQAAAYIHMLDGNSGQVTYGVGVSSNITRASVRAIFSAVNRLGLIVK